MLGKTIFTDIDDTVLQCSELFEDFFNVRLGRKPKAFVHDARLAYDIDDDTAKEIIHDFWRSDAMTSLEPEACALEVLPRLYAQGWKFVAVTACANFPDIMERRIENLNKAFGFAFEEVHCSGYGNLDIDGNNLKANILSQYEPGIWVEDNFQNAVAGAMIGHKTFLIDRKHNANLNHELVTRVKTWHEIENYIKGL